MMCRQCCRAKSKAETLDCPTHKMFKKTHADRAKQKEEEEGGGADQNMSKSLPLETSPPSN